MDLIKMILIITDYTIVANSSENFESLFTLSGIVDLVIKLINCN